MKISKIYLLIALFLYFVLFIPLMYGYGVNKYTLGKTTEVTPSGNMVDIGVSDTAQIKVEGKRWWGKKVIYTNAYGYINIAYPAYLFPIVAKVDETVYWHIYVILLFVIFLIYLALYILEDIGLLTYSNE